MKKVMRTGHTYWTDGEVFDEKPYRTATFNFGPGRRFVVAHREGAPVSLGRGGASFWSLHGRDIGMLAPEGYGDPRRMK
jgi:hypothetical protein